MAPERGNAYPLRNEEGGMNGKGIVTGLLAVALIGGAGLYYSLEYAYYTPVPADSPAARIELTSVVTHAPELVPVEDFQGIDADTSPLRYRACFRLPTSMATLTESFVIYDKPTPLVAPSRFGCFDAGAIDDALKHDKAVAFLGQANIYYGIDRVIAVFDDGRAYAWNQMNHCGEVVYDGEPAPKGCPPPPETN
jgi:hypothetical protein